MTTMNTPMTAQPTTLVQKVAQGNPPGGVGQWRERAYRAVAPRAPPSATTATTGAWPCPRDRRAGPAGARRLSGAVMAVPLLLAGARTHGRAPSQAGTVGGAFAAVRVRRAPPPRREDD